MPRNDRTGVTPGSRRNKPASQTRSCVPEWAWTKLSRELHSMCIFERTVTSACDGLSWGPRSLAPPSACVSGATALRFRIFAAVCNSTELRTEWFVWERATERQSVRESARATNPEQMTILFGAAVNLSRGGSVHVPGPGARNGPN